MSAEPLLEPQLRAMGAQLREARIAQDINPRALETDLRTTHRHLLALEEGQTRLFYSDSFYCDLFARYAQVLGFSQDEIQAMVAQLREPIAPPRVDTASALVDNAVEKEPKPEDQTSTTPQASIELVLPVAAASTSPALASADDAAKASTDEAAASGVTQPPPAPAKKKSSFNGLQVGLAFLLIIGLAFLVSNPSEPETESSQPSGPQTPDATASIQKPDIEASPVPAPQAVTSPTTITASASPSATAINPTPPAAQVAVAPPTSAQPIASPATTTPSALAGSATSSASSATPVVSSEMELTFKTRGWIWVREADDSVREFVVPEGQTIRFQEIPIFIVLPAPEQIEAKVLGKAVALRRTEEDKNHGRFTRSMLRQAAISGRIPAPASPQ